MGVGCDVILRTAKQGDHEPCHDKRMSAKTGLKSPIAAYRSRSHIFIIVFFNFFIFYFRILTLFATHNSSFDGHLI